MRRGGKPHIDWARGPVKHPRRDLEPATRWGAAQRTVENDTSCLLDGRVNGHGMPEPGMPGIHNRTEHDPVGVLKPCCTIPCGRTAASAICRRPITPSSVSRHRNGTGRCAQSGASRPVPLQHRACKAQMANRLYPPVDEKRGSGHAAPFDQSDVMRRRERLCSNDTSADSRADTGPCA
jgi:hypothetical protein